MNIFIKFIISVVFPARVLSSQIITTDSITELETELNKADADTLVIFDCNDTLIHKTDSIFSWQNKRAFKRYLELANIAQPLETSYLNELQYIVKQNKTGFS